MAWWMRGDVVYLSFSNAFYTIIHSIFIEKMKYKVDEWTMRWPAELKGL